MKKLLFLFIILFSITLPFHSCKKGPDDPFISFRSRASRLSGHWKIVKGSEVYTFNNTDNISTTDIANGSFSISTPGGNSTSNKSGTIFLDYNFSKGGTYSYNRVEYYGGQADSSSGSGTWAFLSASGSMKNKEAIELTELNSSISVNGTTTNNSYINNNQGIVWVLTGLRNDYLIIDSQETQSSPNYTSTVIHYEFSKE